MKFLKKTVIASILILASIHVVAAFTSPPPEPPKPISTELRAEVTRSIKPLSSVDLRQKISVNNGKKTLLFLYTSWCPHCRNAMPQMLDMQHKGAFDNVQVIYFSTDQEPEKLIRYIAEHQYHKAFTPYIFQGDDPQKLMLVTNSYGMSWRGGIPYAAVISADGKLLAETNSNNGWEDVNREIRRFR